MVMCKSKSGLDIMYGCLVLLTVFGITPAAYASGLTDNYASLHAPVVLLLALVLQLPQT